MPPENVKTRLKESNVPPLNNDFESNMPQLFILDSRTFVAKSALSRLHAFWGALLAKMWWEGAQKILKDRGFSFAPSIPTNCHLTPTPCQHIPFSAIPILLNNGVGSMFPVEIPDKYQDTFVLSFALISQPSSQYSQWCERYSNDVQIIYFRSRFFTCIFMVVCVRVL